MRARAELQRMHEVADVYGVAITLTCVPFIPQREGDGEGANRNLRPEEMDGVSDRVAVADPGAMPYAMQDRVERTQVMVWQRAKRYANKLRGILYVLPPMDELVRRGKEITIAVEEFGTAEGKPQPHVLTVREAEALIIEVDKAWMEAKRREGPSA